MSDATLTKPEIDWARVLTEPVTGIVLAGGRSRPFGGDKAWVRLGGRPMIQWVLDALKAVTHCQVVVAREAGDLGSLGVDVVIDRFDVRGPYTGIHAGLKAARTDLCLVVACDMPLVRADLLGLLADAVGPTHAAVPYVGEGEPPTAGPHVPARDYGLQPLLAAYRRRSLVPLEKLLRTGHVSGPALMSVLKARIVEPEVWQRADPDGRSFFNVNTYEDLAEAARILSGQV